MGFPPHRMQSRRSGGRSCTRAWLVALSLLAACDSRTRQDSTPTPEPAPDRFVVFSQPALVIDRLGVPVSPPVTVGSTPAPDTLASDSPDVVSVETSGALVAHRNGDATVRAQRGGETLRVEVRAASQVTLVPAEIDLRPGDEVQLALVPAGGAEPVAADAVQWYTDAPSVAMVRAGRVEAGTEPGVATITAVYGSLSTKARVTVSVSRGPAIAVEPARPVLRVGGAVTFSARAGAGPVDVRWSVKPGTVLKQSGQATFVARAPGSAEVCASSRLRSSCTRVTVRR